MVVDSYQQEICLSEIIDMNSSLIEEPVDRVGHSPLLAVY